MKKKKCTKCGRELPATKKYFYVRVNDKLRNSCKDCHIKIAGKWVQDWRRRTKKRAVRLLGGKCQKCGYNRCLSALDFHHKRDKKSTICSMLATPMAWGKIEKEIRKCILLCKNCHAELHNNK